MITFLQPGLAWALALPAAVLALYLLKRKYVPRQVPSTFLWQRSQRDYAANQPFQRLRKNLLMILQLLAALVLALAMMRPALTAGEAGRTVLIFDVSGSMQAETEGKSRLERAKEQALEYVQTLPEGEEITVLTAGGEVRQLLAASRDREEARQAIRSVAEERGEASLEKAVSLARAIQREESGEATAAVRVYSDTYIPSEGITAVNAGHGGENRAVYSLTAEENTAFARLVNYGTECSVTVTLRADGQLRDAREIQIPAGETAGVSFSLPEGTRKVRVEIREGDVLPADNQLEARVLRKQSRLIAVASADSVFLESALKAGRDLTVVRTTEEELMTVEADLYIRGTLPMIFSREPSGNVITWEAEPATANAALAVNTASPLAEGLTFRNISLRSYLPLHGGTPVLTCGEDTVVALGEGEAVIGFDLHDSNLPLKYDFPVLVQKLVEELLPDVFPEEAEEEDLRDDPMPLAESDVREVAPSVTSEIEEAQNRRGKELTEILLVIFLLLLLAEWGVNRYVR